MICKWSGDVFETVERFASVFPKAVRWSRRSLSCFVGSEPRTSIFLRFCWQIITIKIIFGDKKTYILRTIWKGLVRYEQMLRYGGSTAPKLIRNWPPELSLSLLHHKGWLWRLDKTGGGRAEGVGKPGSLRPVGDSKARLSLVITFVNRTLVGSHSIFIHRIWNTNFT